jgi:hypothetical protein
LRLPAISLWGGKTCCALIATPNVDNANRRQKKAKAKLQATCNSYAERKSVFVFANYLSDFLVWNYAMSGFKRGIEKAGTGSVPACICVLNSLKFRLLPKNCQTGKL